MLPFIHCLLSVPALLGVLPIYVTLLVPTIYLLVIMPPAFGVCEKPSVDALNESLASRWGEPTELSVYMHNNWDALVNAGTAHVHELLCFRFAYTQLLLGGFLLWKGIYVVGGLVILQAVLFRMTEKKVNLPKSCCNDSKMKLSLDLSVRKQWRLAVAALIAYGEISEKNAAKMIARHLEEDELVRESVRLARQAGF